MLSFLAGPSRGRFQTSLGAVSALVLATGVAGAQTFVASTSAVADVPGMSVLDDGSLVEIGGAAPRPVFTEGHWQAVAGLVPGDVDALGRRPGAAPGDWSEWVFSTLSDEGGFEDGDVLGFAQGGGLEVVVSEEALALALGATSAIDLDALSFDDEGRLHFSLQSGLSESAVGPIEDGDILVYDSLGFVTVALTEAEVQARFEEASGLSSAIGDVQGLVWTTSGYRVVTQGPSSTDGAVLELGPTPQFLVDEDGVGLGGAEIDALAPFDGASHAGTIWTGASEAAPEAVMPAGYRGGAPGAHLMVAVAGNGGFAALPGLTGFGAFYVDLGDSYLTQVQLPMVMLDAAGELETTIKLPPGVGGAGLGDGSGWTFQVIDLDRLMLSAPYRVVLE